MRIARKDGKVFEWEFVHFGRGEWSTNLLRVNGDLASCMGDPVHTTKQAARDAARSMTPHMTYLPGLGWCVVTD